jgi:4-oxalmesaconate hydratase
MDKPPLEELVLRNVFFDTCVYHQPGIDLLLEVVPAENILFASELLGAVRGIDPISGHHFDDTRRYVDGSARATVDEKALIFSGNAKRVFPRIRS